MSGRSRVVALVWAISTSTFACSGPNAQRLIADTRLLGGGIWAVGVFATLGLWLLSGTDRRAMALPAVSCLLPMGMLLADKGISGDCGTTAASLIMVWFFAQLALIAWHVRRGARRGGR